jgi:signal transduction histidine kinase
LKVVLPSVRPGLGSRIGAGTGSAVGVVPEASRRRCCDDVAMTGTATGRHTGIVVSSLAWVLAVSGLVTAVLFDRRLDRIGHAELQTFAPETWVVIAAIGAALVVGSALRVRRPDHPVGWLFLALGVSLGVAGAIDGYAVYGAVAQPGSLPGAAAAAHVGDVTFVAWLVLVALVLYLTPTGHALSPWWGTALRVTVVGGILAVLGGLLGDRSLDPPFRAVRNPWSIGALVTPLRFVGLVGTLLVGLGLIAAGASMMVRYRRSVGVERKQLQWMYLAAAPLPLFVPAAFVSAWTGHPAALLVATGGVVVAVPVAAGLAISRFHLYEVDRILSRTFAYVAMSAVLAVTYAAVVVAAGRTLSGLADSSVVAAVIATLVAVTIASPVRAGIQDALDRRFNRRRFEAVRFVQDRLRTSARSDVDDVVRRGVGDPTLTIAYRSEERDQWSTAGGVPVSPCADAVEVIRDGKPIARIGFDAGTVDRGVVEAVGAAAAAELDNARLRAAISAQLVEVNESRARIAAAQTAERRRIERNLHDGAQQRLLALALRLQAAQLNGTSDRLRDALADGVEELRATVGELRDLANGLHPSVLTDGGIAAALDDLARRSPVPIDVSASDRRFDPDIEACAWFVACEAVTNSQKHSGASRITVDVRASDGWLDLVVEDDGVGGADAEGSGIQGVHDRADAAGGSLMVSERPSGGTRVHARLPCGW